MERKVVSGIMLILLSVGMFSLTFNIQPLKSEPVTGEKSIIIGTTDKITVLDPAKCYDFYTWEVFNNIGEGLMKYKLGTTELEMGIAEYYNVSPNGLNYTFKLRDGMMFTDGEPLDAAA